MTTRTEIAGPVPGATPADQAVFLAGVLAEQSIRSATLTDQAGPRLLIARSDDLPGILEAALSTCSDAQLICHDLDLTVDLLPSGLRWRTTRSSIAALFNAGSP